MLWLGFLEVFLDALKREASACMGPITLMFLSLLSLA